MIKHRKYIGLFVLVILVIAAISASTGIFSRDGSGEYSYESIRGQKVMIYGKGLYKHMSADVAVQGIAQDYVTLGIALPLLLIGFIWAGKGSLRGQLLLSGTLFYLFVTYLFYTCMGMYNYLFLAYVILLACTFLALVLTLYDFDLKTLSAAYDQSYPRRFAGVFLIVNTILIALLWLSMIVPPLLDGSIYPEGLQHYTTLIVQGLDLGLLLPLGFVTALLFLKKRRIALLLMPVYMVFLAILMTALSAKIIAMGLQGANIIPSVFIIPLINITAVIAALLLLKHIKPHKAA